MILYRYSNNNIIYKLLNIIIAIILIKDAAKRAVPYRRVTFNIFFFIHSYYVYYYFDEILKSQKGHIVIKICVLCVCVFYI